MLFNIFLRIEKLYEIRVSANSGFMEMQGHGIQFNIKYLNLCIIMNYRVK